MSDTDNLGPGRGKALELVSRFATDTHWEDIGSCNPDFDPAKHLIDMPHKELGGLFTDFINSGGRAASIFINGMRVKYCPPLLKEEINYLQLFRSTDFTLSKCLRQELRRLGAKQNSIGCYVGIVELGQDIGSFDAFQTGYELFEGSISCQPADILSVVVSLTAHGGINPNNERHYLAVNDDHFRDRVCAITHHGKHWNIEDGCEEILGPRDHLIFTFAR